LDKYLKFRNPWPVQCGVNFTGPNSLPAPAYRQAGAFGTTNFFRDDTIIHISRPLALLTRGHAKKIDLTPTNTNVVLYKISSGEYVKKKKNYSPDGNYC